MGALTRCSFLFFLSHFICTVCLVATKGGDSESALLHQGGSVSDVDKSLPGSTLRINEIRMHVQGFLSGPVSVQSISATRRAFAAIKSDGSVVTWGDPREGGDSDAVREQLRKGVRSISATTSAFAAIKSDGSVVTWGHPDYGGDSFARLTSYGGPWRTVDVRVDKRKVDVREQLRSGVQSISASHAAFAALKSDGSVVTWGNMHFGGDSDVVREQLGIDVQSISAAAGGFAAIKSDGSVVTWGRSEFMSGSPGAAPIGDSGAVREVGDSGAVREQLRTGVQSISATVSAFAAIKSDGSVVTWPGEDPTPVETRLRCTWFSEARRNGGDSSAVREQLLSGVLRISATQGAFAALKSDGSVVTWGDPDYGGDSGAVREQLCNGVESIVATKYAFAAIKSDASVVIWGRPHFYGHGLWHQLRSGVRSTSAMYGDLMWGEEPPAGPSAPGSPRFGRDSVAVREQLCSGVQSISANFYGLAAIKSDGSVVTWANPQASGVCNVSISSRKRAQEELRPGPDKKYVLLDVLLDVQNWLRRIRKTMDESPDGSDVEPPS